MINKEGFKICFIGCGKLGKPTAELMAEHYEVNAYDVQDIKPVGVKTFTVAAEAVKNCDFVFVAVQTPHAPQYDGTKPVSDLPPRDFDYSILKLAISNFSSALKKDCTVVIVSTVLPGTIRNHIKPLIPVGVTLIYNPYLIAMGTVREDLINPEMLIMGSENGRVEEMHPLVQLYQPFINTDTRVEQVTWEEAEAIKIFYNTFISMKLSFVNMIQDVANKIEHINPDTVSKAIASSALRITSSAYMQPGMGDGGPCHPRDNIVLRYLSDKLNLGYDLFGAIATSRDMQARNLALFLLSFSNEVVILGRAYKRGINLDDGSYAVLVGSFICSEGGTVNYYDPDMNYTDLNYNNKQVFLINHYTDWLHTFPFPDGCTIVDPWRKWTNTNPSIKVVYYGIKSAL